MQGREESEDWHVAYSSSLSGIAGGAGLLMITQSWADRKEFHGIS